MVLNTLDDAVLDGATIRNTDARRRLLHVGCGGANPDKIPAQFFAAGAWTEIRLDIDPSVEPDILASITEMRGVADASVDAIWSSHNLEHLPAHEVPQALGEFHRVLSRGGFALITLPDIQQVAALVAEGRLEDEAYMSQLGPIAPIDILYGYRPSIALGNGFMAHRTGFTAGTLERHLRAAGFEDVRVVRDGRYALWAQATKAAG